MSNEKLSEMFREYSEALGQAMVAYGPIDEQNRDQRTARSEAARDKVQPLWEAYEKARQAARKSTP